MIVVDRFWVGLGAPQSRLWGASALDVLGALLLTGLAMGSLTVDYRHPVAVLPALTVALATMPVAWRRRAPLGCAAAFLAGVAASAAATDEGVRCAAVYPAGMLIGYSVGLRCERTASLAGITMLLTAQLLESVTDRQVSIAVFPLFGLLTLGVWMAGRVVRSRSRIAEDLRDRTSALERQREETARLAVDVEKLRVASALDISARRRVEEIMELSERGESAVTADPEQARAAFAGIEESGRESLNEMRGVLGVLRSDERRELAPLPTLAQIDALLARARAGGHVVELGIDGEPLQLPEELDVSAYRILQHLVMAGLEAADGAPIAVAVRYMPGALLLEVAGEVRGTSDRPEALIAARERATVHGGTVTVDLPSPGRRLLRARLPVAPAHG
jgi:glucose-6-phosphate-specific signal transduction histidine kinase